MWTSQTNYTIEYNLTLVFSVESRKPLSSIYKRRGIQSMSAFLHENWCMRSQLSPFSHSRDQVQFKRETMTNNYSFLIHQMKWIHWFSSVVMKIGWSRVIYSTISRQSILSVFTFPSETLITGQWHRQMEREGKKGKIKSATLIYFESIEVENSWRWWRRFDLSFDVEINFVWNKIDATHFPFQLHFNADTAIKHVIQYTQHISHSTDCSYSLIRKMTIMSSVWRERYRFDWLIFEIDVNRTWTPKVHSQRSKESKKIKNKMNRN